jgi:hypothetical protein
MNYNNVMKKIEAILSAASNKPKRKSAGAKGLLAPRENMSRGGASKPMSDDDMPVELKLARYIANIRKAKNEMKKTAKKEKDAR